MEHWWKNTEVLRETPVPVTLFSLKNHTCSALVLNQDLCDERSATYHLILGKARLKYLLLLMWFVQYLSYE